MIRQRCVPVVALIALALVGAGCSSSGSGGGLFPAASSVGPGASGSGSVSGSTGATGSASPTGDEAEVRRVAGEYADSTDARQICTTLVTPRLVLEIYRTQATCLSTSGGSGATPSLSTIESVEVTGTSAQVGVRSTSGSVTVQGHLGLRKSAGVWRVDSYGDDLVRATLIAEVQQPVTSGALTVPALRTCMVQKIPSASMTILRSFLFASLRRDPQARNIGAQFLNICPVPLSAYVAGRLMDAVSTRGRTPAQLQCIQRTLANLLPVTGLAPKAVQSNVDGATKAALAGLVQGAEKTCG